MTMTMMIFTLGAEVRNPIEGENSFSCPYCYFHCKLRKTIYQHIAEVHSMKKFSYQFYV